MGLRKKCRHVRAGADPEACRCTWVADFYVAGKRQYRSLGPDLPSARREHLRLVGALARGELPVERPDGVRFAAAAQAWLSQKSSSLADNTLNSYPSALRHAVAWLDPQDVRHVDAAELARMGAAQLADGLAPRYVRQIRTIARMVLDFAHDQGWREEGAPKLRRGLIPKVQEDPRVLGPAHVEQALGHLTEPWRSLSELAWLTGLRSAEALALRAVDVDGTRLHVSRSRSRATGADGPTKGRNVRAVDLSARALAALARAPGTARLWPVGYSAWLRHWHDALLAAGIERCGLHALRHSNAALRLTSGQPLPYVARQLGHATASFTLQVYGRWIPGERDNPALLDAAIHALAFPEAAATANHSPRAAAAAGRARRRVRGA